MTLASNLKLPVLDLNFYNFVVFPIKTIDGRETTKSGKQGPKYLYLMYLTGATFLSQA